MKDPIAFKNGEYIPASECRLSIYDLGITNGASVTDFLRTFHQKPYRTEDHAARLHRACRNAYIKPPFSVEQTIEITNKLAAANEEAFPGRELGIIYYVTAGENMVYAGSAGKAGNLTPTYVQHVFPLPFYLWKNLYTEGARLITPAVPHLPPQCVSPKGKHRNRLHMWIGDKQIQGIDPGAMGLYLDLNGNITETGGSNFVIFRDGKVISPRSRNILWGISLQVLTEILAKMGIEFVEDDISVFDAVNADECWLTTSPYCIAPVKSLNGIDICSGKPGAMWRRILANWSDLVQKDLYLEITESVQVN
jgi:branched-chain amino acid aminotransferase